jgi:hypothetical protein
MAGQRRTKFTNVEIDFSRGEDFETVARRVAEKLRAIPTAFYTDEGPEAIVMLIQKEGGSAPDPPPPPDGPGVTQRRKK